MDTIKIRNDGRTVYHFPVTVEDVTDQGKVTIERYRVVLGESADAQLTRPDPKKPGQTKKVPNIARVPDDAFDKGWEPTKSDIYLPAPTVVMTVDQFATEVFPVGSTARGIIDNLIGEGTVVLDESKPGSLERAELRLAKQAADIRAAAAAAAAKQASPEA